MGRGPLSRPLAALRSSVTTAAVAPVVRASLHRLAIAGVVIVAGASWLPQPAFSSVTSPYIADTVLGPALPPAPAAQASEQPAVLQPFSGPAIVIPGPPAAPPAGPAPAPDVASVEPGSIWAKITRETGIWSGWDTDAKEFAKVPPEITVQIIELRGARAYVHFPGDNRGHAAGQVWIDRGALAELPWPRWARARQAVALRAEPDPAAAEVLSLTRGSYVELTGQTRGRWAEAFFLADKGSREGVVGWVDGYEIMLPRGDQAEMSTYVLTRSALQTATADLGLKVPYRSQLDGAPYAEANCGPTSIAMALGALGVEGESLEQLRVLALQAQDNSARCHDCGIFIESLATVAGARGVKVSGLRDTPESLHRWTVDEVRQALQTGKVVIPQVKFRNLPGRAKSSYGGDHYIVISGLAGGGFVYNDPIDSDGRGYARVISADQLEKAMASATPDYARTAFAVGR